VLVIVCNSYIFKAVAKNIKHEMDKKFGASWHVIVGNVYGNCVRGPLLRNGVLQEQISDLKFLMKPARCCTFSKEPAWPFVFGSVDILGLI